MAKWADYLISQVQYNSAETHITKVVAHVDNGDTVGKGSEMTRATVVESLGKGTTFMTIYRDKEGKWAKGAEVRAVTIEGVKYIRTDADATQKDNLGSLPRF